MKADRLLTLTALVVMGIMCTLPFINSKAGGVREPKTRGRSPGFTTNYASAYLGATLTDFSHACKGASSVLNDATEKYMICSCEARRKFFTVQLIREIEVRIITLVNLEHFSSSVKNFTLLGSKKYPTSEWRVLGNLEANPWRGTQHFDVAPQEPVRFLRFLWATSHSDDSWCTLTTFKAYGVDVLETLTEDYVSDTEESPYQPPEIPLPALPTTVTPSEQAGADTHTATSAMGLCSPTHETKPRDVKTPSRSVDQVEALFTSSNSGCGGSSSNSSSSSSTNGSGSGSGSSSSSSSSSGSSSSGSSSSSRSCGGGGESLSYYCDYGGVLDNASLTCLPHERQAFLARSYCTCPSRTVISAKTTLPSKPFQGGAALQILTQMSKQLKAMQQELEESQMRQRKMQERLNLTEATLRYFGTHFRDSSRSAGDYRDRLLEIKKELDVMKSRLSLRLEAGGHSSSGDAILWVWVLCSNVLATVAVAAVCFGNRPNLPGRTQRLSVLGSPR
ncbi:hypothetical protein DQ04_05421040 [Trypanosoma grayi]|uniref:hypothetical protein n=1 Tax=Trypanosoma grayi TaxID=71804 RepID=UPI0004F43CA9|nr:hypothetical protein DQ04_05421040 [Trypanosoma grayi]KEG09321.1 hypothetical protein DQ04_05421040 [Trypanosoma grayi]